MMTNKTIDIIERLEAETTIETKLRILNEMLLIDFLSEAGYREDRAWTNTENELLDKICVFAKKMVKLQLDEFNEHFNLKQHE